MTDSSARAGPRYQLDHAIIGSSPAGDGAGNAVGQEGNFGRFWFDGYAVNIRLREDGRLRAERVVKPLAFPTALHALWYRLKTAVGAEGGSAWTLRQRDGIDVITHCWARHRLRSLACYVPQALPVAVPTMSDAAVPSVDRGALSLSSELSGAAFGATPVLDCVLGHLGFHGRATLTLAGVHVGAPFDTVLMQARSVRSLDGIKTFAARYGLDPGAAESQLSPSQQAEVLTVLVDRIPRLPYPLCDDAVQYLSTVALHLHERLPSQNALLAFVERCVASGVHKCFRASFVRALASRPIDNTAPARLAMLSIGGWGRSYGSILLPDKAAYKALIGALTGQEPPESFVAVMAVLLGRVKHMVERRALWTALHGYVFAKLLETPAVPDPKGVAVAARQLAAMAECLWQLVDGDPDDEYRPYMEPLMSVRMRTLLLALEVLPLRGADAAVLACALATALLRFRPGSFERASGVALLDKWRDGATLTSRQRMQVALAFLPLRPDDTRAALWNALWDSIEKDRLNDCAAAAARQLSVVPGHLGWQRALDYCRDGAKAWPAQRGEVLLALIRLIDKDGGTPDSADAAVIKSGIRDAAVQLLRQGGPVTPLVRCRWTPDSDVLTEIVQHLPWPTRADALAERLKESVQPWGDREIAVLQAQLTELAGRMGKGAHDDMRPAFERLLTAFSEHCRAKGLHGPRAWNAALNLASSLLPLVRTGLEKDGAWTFAALAQLVDCLMQLEAGQPDAGRSRWIARIRTLWDDAWELPHLVSPADRQAMLDVLADRMRFGAGGPSPCRRHVWSELAMQHALWALTGDLPDRGRLVNMLAWAVYPLDARQKRIPRFDALHKHIWTEAMCLPDDQFEAVARNMVGNWFHRAPVDRNERRAWRSAGEAFRGRIERMAGGRRAPRLIMLRIREDA